jgi:murein hydrolase activator
VRHCARDTSAEGAREAMGDRGLASAETVRRYLAKLLFAVLVLASTSAPAGPSAADDQAIAVHKRDLIDVERRVQNLEQDLGDRRDRRDILLEELEQSERNIGDLARAGRQLAAMVGEQERALQGLRDRLSVEQVALERERDALGSLLRSAYATGRGDRIRMLLDQEDPNRLSRVMSYYGYLNRFRLKRIGAVALRARKLQGLTREAEEEKTRLTMLARKQDETRERLTAAQNERFALLSALEQTIATAQESVASLRTEAREMRVLLEELERRARLLPEADLSQESLKNLRGNLPWPLPAARPLSRYGAPKGDGSQRWDGVVLAAEEGAEVRAVHPGRVAYADWLRGFGLLIIIEHDDGYMTLYGHNQTLLKEPGEWVAASDVIALSGSSGGRTSPGLYFAIRHRGKPLNPEQWCKRKIGSGREPFPSMPLAAKHDGLSSLESRGRWWTACRAVAVSVGRARSFFL